MPFSLEDSLAEDDDTLTFVLVGGPYETTFIISCLLTLMQVGFLFTPPVLSYVFGEDDAVPSH